MGLFGRRKPVAAPKVARCSECNEEKSIYDVWCFACGAPQADYQLPDQTVTDEIEEQEFIRTPLPNTKYGVG
ncbi:hypothetical protein ccbrp13_56520 [Ktedonobacteria bacterium brp13]|nr:hypothetical protein ccbrp13_56520 [Ktedonobacteria bacterium brp13]